MPRTAHPDVRQKILDAAEDRLWHYGFKKTTIDEIAADAEVGKGTVYLYFDSKETIALAIMARFKEASLEQTARIAQDEAKDPVQKLKEMLAQPVLCAHQRYGETPAALELIVALKPHIRAHMHPYTEQELALLATVLEEGNQRGLFAVENPRQTAQTLKYMCYGFWPPYPCVAEPARIREEIARIVDLAVRGLRSVNHA